MDQVEKDLKGQIRIGIAIFTQQNNHVTPSEHSHHYTATDCFHPP